MLINHTEKLAYAKLKEQNTIVDFVAWYHQKMIPEVLTLPSC